ncbi:hypothetical protein [Nocardia carnea]|uniref:hypothetical protein n=1 Tax=Nocardia carnea TaxID=37328 RepID=UPI00245442AC|nr:hypothetical protein [Nocardia carnea]
MGSAEFLLAGVLPAVAADLDTTLASAGLLITAFALGVVLGGPPLAVLSLRWPRRTALGVVAFVLNPAVYGRVFAIAADAPTLAGATTVSAFQLGISITPVLAAAPLTQGAALTSVCLIGAALAATAIPLILLDRARMAR